MKIKIVPIERLDPKGYQKFGLIMGTVIGVLFGCLIPWIFNSQLPDWSDIAVSIPLWITYAFYVWSVLLPSTLVVVYVPWMHFGRCMGSINTCVILGLIYYLLFTPMALLLSLLGKVPLERKYEYNEDSYWKPCHDRPKEHMEHNY